MASVPKKLLAEFFAMMIILFTIIMGKGELRVFLVFAVCVAFTAGISGAHLNGSVTIAIYLRNKKKGEEANFGEMISYIVAQIAGGCLGGVLAAICGATNNVIGVRDPFNQLQGFMVEFVMCLMLNILVQYLCDSDNEPTHATMAGSMVGGAIATNAFTNGKITGGIINPSIAVALYVYGLVFASDKPNVLDLWVYLAAPLAAAVVAVIYYNGIMKNKDGNDADTTKDVSV